MKKQVAYACVLSSILYGCETWFTNSFGKAETMYTKIVKALLDVRNTTCNDICLVEADMPSFEALVTKRMKKYLQKKIPNLDDEDPLTKAIELCRTANTASYRRIQALLPDESDVVEEDKVKRMDRIRTSTSSKRVMFVQLNPLLQQHKLYKNNALKEHKRIEFTRFRVSSHNLKVETGRWGRIERESRVCSCSLGGIHDESHVLFRCDLTNDIREKYQIQTDSFADVFNDKEDETLSDIFYELSEKFAK